jgi:hypothetical protein
MFNYVIIGGGISGLYANYLLSNKYNTLLLEKNDYFGGRAKDMKWHSTNIKLGAGIVEGQMHIEKNKYEPMDNIHLTKLIKKLNVKKVTFNSEKKVLNDDFNMSKANDNIESMYKILKKYGNRDIYYLTVEEFIIKYFSKDFLDEYKSNSEDTDFFNSDLSYYIKYYNMTDNENKKYKATGISWSELSSKLTRDNCINNYLVNTITRENDYFIINNEIKTQNIIFAVTLKALEQINKKNKLFSLDYSSYLGSVPFFRVYAYFKNGYNKSQLPAPFVIVNNQLQKIIQISDNVIMIGYGDSNNAHYWNRISKLPKYKQIETVERKINELSLNLGKVDDVIIKYWDTGVHYYKPIRDEKFNNILKKLSHPAKNIYVIGEMVSKKQGWVEGAVESTDRVLKSILKKS